MTAVYVPLRTCVACGLKTRKDYLLRLVLGRFAEVILDPTGKLPGRGAYLCDKEDCKDIGLKKNRLDRHLRARISQENKIKIAEALTQDH